MKNRQDGFTIVELLIVVVVIAILAAITIVSYNGITSNANDSAVKSNLSTIVKKSMANAVEQGGTAPYTTIAQLNSLGFKASKGAYAVSPQSGINLSYCTNADATRMGVIAKSKSGKMFYIVNGGSIQEYTGAWHDTSAGPNCAAMDSALVNSLTGYVAADTSSSGPWRAWVGGN